jgi:hypothetical protein
MSALPHMSDAEVQALSDAELEDRRLYLWDFARQMFLERGRRSDAGVRAKIDLPGLTDHELRALEVQVAAELAKREEAS